MSSLSNKHSAEYRFHRPPTGGQPGPAPSVTLEAESHLHGAALALQHFRQLGCDISVPLAHLDLTSADGVTHTLLVDEVVNWLSDPKQMVFVQHEHLADLLS
jgi:hypothetical protein